MCYATVRSIETWIEIFGKTDATNCSAEDAIARRILGDIVHYRHGCRYEDADVKQLANAIRAYARMVHECGLTD